MLKSFLTEDLIIKKLFTFATAQKDNKFKLHTSRIGFEFNRLCKPISYGTVLTKSVNSCFIETNLKEILYQMNCSTVFMFRLTSEYCVSTIATVAKNFGYYPSLISYANTYYD